MRFDHRRVKRVSAWAVLSSLIWMTILSSVTIAWAQETPVGSRPTVSVTEENSQNNDRTAGILGRDMLENNADKFFRVYMLPGTAILVLVFAATLTAIFYSKSETE